MLERDVIDAIEEAIPRHVEPRGAAIEALQAVQRRRGWVDDEALAEAARRLEMSAAELDSVATYYNRIFRRPVGRHVIFLCDGVTCWMSGYPSLRKDLGRMLGIDFGGTSADGRFTLLPLSCIGACDRAPAMIVDEDEYGQVEPARIGKILDDYR